MKFYYKFGVCLFVSYIMLYEVGVIFEIEVVDIVVGKMESGCDYWKINVNGYVFFLEMEGGEILSEGVVIL